ncbi:flagellar hook-associated protein FlgK [Lachnospiraceae bacterium ZAX-1]
MPSTFFGLTIASSAINAFQVAVNTTAHNISNLNTKGYTRQEAIREAAEALRVFQKYGSAGSGVDTPMIQQIRDVYYDVKYWNNNSDKNLYETRLYYNRQIEDYILDDDTLRGFTTILDDMFNAMDTLKTNAGDKDKRQQFIGKAQNLTSFFNSLSVGFSKIQDTCNQEISTQIGKVNALAEKCVSLNRQINVIELKGGHAYDLRDQRNLLIDELSAIIPVEVKETPIENSNYPEVYLGGTNYVVKINGQTLVNSFEYKVLEVTARVDKINQSDVDGLYDIVWSDSKMPLATTAGKASGILRGLFEMRDGNNKENFTAMVDRVDAGGTQLVLKNASITEINMMTMNDEGIITIKNKDYKYTGFSYDAATKEYTFQLDPPMPTGAQADAPGKTVEIGTPIDAMGIPYYMAQLNTFLRAFCQGFNSLQKAGSDANGDDGKSLFIALNPSDGTEAGFDQYDPSGNMDSSWDSYYRLTAANLAIAAATVKNPQLLATVTKGANPDDVDQYDLVNEMLKLKSDVKLFRGGGTDEFLQCLISDNSVDTEKSRIFFQNYQNLSNTIEQKRMSISGVDEDEEALNLVKFQHAYNLASRMVQTMSEMYDRLILQTGV